MSTAGPSYLLLGIEAIRNRAREAVEGLASCRYCPRACRVNRLSDEWAACRSGRHAVVSSWFPHFGEEDCLRGRRGSGTIFFGHCNLRCVFCQNWDISHLPPPGNRDCPRTSTPSEVAAMMLALQRAGCHNINLVTPEHVVPQVLEALALAIPAGLRLPIVYNTSAYDSLDSLRLLEGIVDIYMPDFKLWSPEACRRYLKAEDYANVARAVIREMHRQTGSLVLDGSGVAVRGVLIRHLVMPGLLAETEAILDWIARRLGTDTYLNLMNQYHPAGSVGSGRYAEIDRRLTRAEFGNAVEMALRMGLERLDHRQ